MRITAHLFHAAAPGCPSRKGETESVDIPCGSGEQLVRWLGHAACLKLAYTNRTVARQNVPLAVLSKDGNILDADHVLREVLLLLSCASCAQVTEAAPGPL